MSFASAHPPRRQRPKAPNHQDADIGFSYSRAAFEQLVASAIEQAKKLGASDAMAHASESSGLNVSTRLGEMENVERNRDKSLAVTVYIGQRSGHASSSDFSPAAVAQTVQAAFDIARFTASDAFAALPDNADIVPAAQQRCDLDLFFPWDISSEQAAQLAQQTEAAAFALDQRISNSEGAVVSAQQSHFFSAHSHGFGGGYASSSHSISVAPIAGSGSQMQRDYWYSAKRNAADLSSPESIGSYAGQRAISRLGARKIATTECPVLFEAPLATGLLRSFVRAISGGSLYRKSSFLIDSIGQQVFASHIDIIEDPFIKSGWASSPFDAEGVRVQARSVVEAGCVQGYFLSSYSARKLGLKTTGNAGGAHNLLFSSRLTEAADDLDAMLHALGRGLFVTELMGSSANPVTGDYSRGASGFWVENGRIAFPVQEITIAGNMKTMLQDIVAVGADRFTQGSISSGSILIKKMKVAGS